MKKKVLSLAVLMASVFTFGSMAQTTDVQKDNSRPCKEAKCQKAGKADIERQSPNPFEGINLSADQQTRLQAVRETAKMQRKALKAEKEAKKSADRADRLAQMKKNRQDYLVQIKEILTPEQYVTFLENVYVQQAPMFKKGGMHKGSMDKGKMAKRDHKKGSNGKHNRGDKSKKADRNIAQAK
ncbi:MAG: hypothetical protein K2K55_06145 [Duncaniella sp.]|nr:hypothetical protein [Duncaniella sp.]